eukprot:5982491-Amphidinium_carterae.3
MLNTQIRARWTLFSVAQVPMGSRQKNVHRVGCVSIDYEFRLFLIHGTTRVTEIEQQPLSCTTVAQRRTCFQNFASHQ